MSKIRFDYRIAEIEPNNYHPKVKNLLLSNIKSLQKSKLILKEIEEKGEYDTRNRLAIWRIKFIDEKEIHKSYYYNDQKNKWVQINNK